MHHVWCMMYDVGWWWWWWWWWWWRWRWRWWWWYWWYIYIYINDIDENHHHGFGYDSTNLLQKTLSLHLDIATKPPIDELHNLPDVVLSPVEWETNIYPPVNKHSNGKSPSWLGNTSSNVGFHCYVRLPECINMAGQLFCIRGHIRHTRTDCHLPFHHLVTMVGLDWKSPPGAQEF